MKIYGVLSLGQSLKKSKDKDLKISIIRSLHLFQKKDNLQKLYKADFHQVSII